MKRRISLAFAALFILLVTVVHANYNPVTVQVEVTDYYSGDPVNEQLYITAKNLDTGEVTVDDRDRTLELAPGNYHISAEGVYAASATSFIGYIGNNQTVSITTYYRQ